MNNDCTQNEFCASLPIELRHQLCAHCERRLLKAGSFQLYRDFERHATLFLDGAYTSTIHSDQDVFSYGDSIPTFILGIPGRMYATNTTFKRNERMFYGNNGIEFMTDCCFAIFEHETIREMFYSHREFAESMQLSAIRIMEDTCETSAILRAPSLYVGVFYLMRFLKNYNLYLTHQQIATVLGRDRSSVSKAASRLKDDEPSAYLAYSANKRRTVELMNPGDL